jgi:hypothetical protein
MDLSFKELQNWYLYIHEDGTTLRQFGDPSDDDLQSVDDGILEIIHPASMTYYYMGSWSDFDKG